MVCNVYATLKKSFDDGDTNNSPMKKMKDEDSEMSAFIKSQPNG
jgi:hypothetical protein